MRLISASSRSVFFISKEQWEKNISFMILDLVVQIQDLLDIDKFEETELIESRVNVIPVNFLAMKL